MGGAQAQTWDCLLQLAHAIRLLLEFTDTAYEEKRYTCGEGKATLGSSAPLRSAKLTLQQSPVFLSPRVASHQSRVGLVPQSTW